MIHTPKQQTNNATLQDTDLLARNKELSDVLRLIGSYYTMSHDTYRAKAFLTASNKIGEYPYAITSGPQARLQLTGIGDSIETAIDEYIATGTSQRLQQLEIKFHDQKQTIDYFRSFYGIGPVKAIELYNHGFRTLEDLWNKADLTDAQKIGILWRDHLKLRIPREELDIINETIGEHLNPHKIKWSIAGSYRRGETSSGDIDVLVEASEDINMEHIVSLLGPLLVAKLAQGHTKYMGILRLSEQYNGHRIDIRLINPEAYAYGLMYFTGSQRFNILMRQRAIDMGLLLNEYGLYRNGQPAVNALTEQDIFNALKVVYMDPVERTKTLNTIKFL